MLEDCVLDKKLILKVKPNSSKTRVVSYSPLVIAVKAAPEGGKANVELMKFLIKELGKDVKLLTGGTSRRKVFLIG